MRLRVPPFTVRWVTGSVIATYICIFALVIQVHEILPSVPSSSQVNEHLRDALDTAWSDLQTITQSPHPYNSRENEVVRAYLLQRVQKLAVQYPHVHVEDDLVSNATYVEGKHMGFYFEGLNILVKVEGRNASLPAVLFSAHFDSESTSPGATDDGMAIVSFLSLIEQLARAPPLRTAIFNLNNGEEEGLCGSHAFMQHPWSKQSGIFLNLEGAGSGGRPILFRASTAQLVSTFQHTSRPHGTVISSDAFALGLIKSTTDFEVYAQKGGLKGLDVSYYTNRDKYHTKDDTVASLNGQRSLWTGLQLTSDIGHALTNLGDDEDENDAKAVYWDVLGRKMVVVAFSDFAQRLPRLVTFTTVFIIGLNGMLWYQGARIVPRREWAFVPASLLSGIIGSALLSILYCKINPLIIYSSDYSVVTSIGTFVILSTLLPLRLFYLRSSASASNLKFLAWSQYFIFILVIQFGYNWILEKSGFGGFYFLAWLYGGAALGLILELVSEVLRSSKSKGTRTARHPDSEGVSELTEPLLETDGLENRQESRSGGVISSYSDVLWMFQLVLTAIPSILLVSPLVLVIASGLGQTIADGSAPAIVYAGLTVLLFLCFVPLIPFAHQISSRLFVIIAVIFVTSTLYNFTAFPFSKHKKVKIFYNQNVDLDSGRKTVTLLGVQPYLRQALRNIPSANAPNSSLSWSTDPIRGLGVASWDSLMPEFSRFTSESSTSDLQALVTSSSRRLDAETAVFTVKGLDTKSCVIIFDQNIVDVHVRRFRQGDGDSGAKFGPSVGMSKDTPYSIPHDGIPIMTLWSREWDTEFEVTVKWNSTAISSETEGGHSRFSWRSLLPFPRRKWPTYTGRIGCQWADNREGQMKALEELFAFLPEWATITSKKALLTVDRSFSI
ncbi:hypothetical protein M408DRAFT_20208 [Serendipita vermifera MAFF 305830]|uniref:Peptide hydrolase n=1 Tax=Serendipita vermifera MAFF 305830 TaxID=933852 RepID=A0A0C3BN48_SERVB|nr:hypothetical protein M408DRAFT_20208 [Serendipita vermifera MAFF 305830]